MEKPSVPFLEVFIWEFGTAPSVRYGNKKRCYSGSYIPFLSWKIQNCFFYFDWIFHSDEEWGDIWDLLLQMILVNFLFLSWPRFIRFRLQITSKTPPAIWLKPACLGDLKRSTPDCCKYAVLWTNNSWFRHEAVKIILLSTFEWSDPWLYSESNVGFTQRRGMRDPILWYIRPHTVTTGILDDSPGQWYMEPVRREIIAKSM